MSPQELLSIQISALEKELSWHEAQCRQLQAEIVALRAKLLEVDDL